MAEAKVESPEVIIVDDSDDDRDFTLLALKKACIPCTPVVFDSGEEAIDYVRRKGKYAGRQYHQRPSLILLDIKLGRMTGFDVLHAIRGDPELRMVPVVMHSNSDEDRDIRLAYEMGANSFLRKPIGLEELMRQTSAMLTYWLTCNVSSREAPRQ